MRSKAFFSSLIFAVLTSLSLSITAAPSAKPELVPSVDAKLTLAEQTDKVNINAADPETLRRDLFGIGAAKAKAIVAFRDSNGPFISIDQLLEVKGIGKALLEKNRERLTID